jgi:hypothetical protein
MWQTNEVWRSVQGPFLGCRVCLQTAYDLRRSRSLDKTKRRHTVDGCQAVEVNGYGYLWRGAPALEVGDQVMLPENPVSRVKEGPGSWQGTVTALGTTYEGSMSMILRRVSQAGGTS